MGTQITKLVAAGKIGKYLDAKKPIKIKVTEVDVIRGSKFKPDQCVLAKASCRSVPNALKTWFYRHAAYVSMWDPSAKKPTTLRYIPSRAAKKAIEKYDKTGKFAPGIYMLQAPAGADTLEQIRARSKKRPGRHQPGGTKTRRKMKGVSKGRLQYAMAY